MSTADEGEHLTRLKALATQSAAANITIPHLKEILSAGAEEFWKPDPIVEAGIKKIAGALELEKGEEVIKSYQIVSHNSMGKEQERILVMTTKALYRVNYLYKEQTCKSVDKEPWSNIELIQFGQFYYNKGILPSVGQLVLAAAIDNLYGMRVFFKSKPDKAALPIPFLTEKFVDECFRTYRPFVNTNLAALEGVVAAETDGKISGSAFDTMQAITREMVFTALALHRHDLQNEQPYLQSYSDTKIAVNATRGLVVAIHNSLDMGLAKDKTEAPKEGAKSPEPTKEGAKTEAKAA
jgi:hypothetical protein